MAYTKIQKLGSFRRMALAFWRAPRDGVIYGTMNIDATRMVESIKRAEAEHGIKLSPGVFIGKGIALGLRASPTMNSKIIWGTLYQKDTVDIFFQVDVEGQDLSGVLIERCDEKSVIEIGKELRDRAQKLREGKDQQYEKTQKGILKKIPPLVLRYVAGLLTFMEFNLGIKLSFLPGYKEDAFGTAMCSNIGSLGIDQAYAPLIPVSRVGFIGLVGRLHDVPMAVNGKVEIRPQLVTSATIDHRIADGVQIGKLVNTARHFYEQDPYLEPTIPGTVLPKRDGVAPPAGTNGGASPAAPGAPAASPSSEAKPLPVV